MRIEAPTRIDFTGGFTDIEPVCHEMPAVHVNAAIDLLTRIELDLQADRSSSVTWQVEDTARAPRQPSSGISERIVSATLAEAGIPAGVRLTIHSQAPVGAGLGASGSLAVGLAAGLLTHNGQEWTPRQVAEMAVRAGRRAGIVGGRQDEYAAAFGGVTCLTFHCDRSTVAPIALTHDAGRQLLSSLMVVHPGGRRNSSEIVRQVIGQYARGERRTRSALVDLNRLATGIALAVATADVVALIGLFGEVLRAQRALHEEILDPRAGALITALGRARIDAAGKVLGGGGRGGCVLIAYLAQDRPMVERLAADHGCRRLPVGGFSPGVHVAH